MANPKQREALRFYRAAGHHLGDATLLLKYRSRTSGAMYLAGYAVECSLKALLLSNVPPSKQAAVLQSFRGTKAHDFDWLVKKIRQRGITMPDAILEHLSKVRRWSVTLRYDPSEKTPKATKEFLAAAEAICEWTKGRL